MKLIKKLGPILDKNGIKLSFGLFKCPYCLLEVVRRLSNGINQKSCGCFKSFGNKNNFKHGESSTKLYNVWNNMKQRCFNPNNKFYKDYGGRGITICQEWLNDYTKFRDWSLTNKYSDKLTIDRIDNNGNYEPFNCRFVTMEVNGQNRRTVKLTLEKVNKIKELYNNKIYNMIELSKQYYVDISTISYIISTKRW